MILQLEEEEEVLMNINKFLVKAKEADIDVAEIKISKTTSSSISIFRGEIDSNEFSSTSSLTARGIYKGKLGAVSSENLNDSSIDSLIKDIKTNATLIEKEEEPIIYQGSKDYKKKNTFRFGGVCIEKQDCFKNHLFCCAYVRRFFLRSYARAECKCGAGQGM